MLFDLGPVSRAELARRTGSKRTTISGIVQPLLDAGLLAEEEPSGRKGVGKPARPLWFSPQSPPVCAVVLMHDHVRSALVDLTGRTSAIHEAAFEGPRTTQGAYINTLQGCIDRTLAGSAKPPMGLGVAVGGLLDPDTGRIAAMNLAPSLAGFDLRGTLKRRYGLDTIVDHHPRAILLGERWFGEGRGLRDFAVIYADEVLGCSLYLNGRPFRGPHGSGGELGHTVVDMNGRTCTCGRQGCWETVATLPRLRDHAREAGLERADALGPGELAHMADADPRAAAVFARYARDLAVGMANLQTLLMPDDFIVYGAATQGGPRLAILLSEELRRLALSVRSSALSVRFGRDEQATTLRGAAGLVISDKLEITY